MNCALSFLPDDLRRVLFGDLQHRTLLFNVLQRWIYQLQKLRTSVVAGNSGNNLGRDPIVSARCAEISLGREVAKCGMKFVKVFSILLLALFEFESVEDE